MPTATARRRVRRVAHPGDRRVRGDEPLAALVGVHAVGHLRREPAGAERVDPHALARPLQRQFPGEVDDGTLARAVVRLLDRRGADVAEHRRDVDDRPAAAGDHRRRAQLRQVPQRGDVDLHRRAESSSVSSSTATDAADAGVVDEHVDAAEPVEHLGDEAFTIGVVGHVGHDDVRAREARRRALEPLGSPGGDHHLRADARGARVRSARRDPTRRR